MSIDNEHSYERLCDRYTKKIMICELVNFQNSLYHLVFSNNYPIELCTYKDINAPSPHPNDAILLIESVRKVKEKRKQ